MFKKDPGRQDCETSISVVRSCKELRTVPSPPGWIGNLANSVADILQPLVLDVPLGCHVASPNSPEQKQAWEISLFPAKTEVVGGRLDGAVFVSPFLLDLRQLLLLFDNVEEVRWQTGRVSCQKDEIGAHVFVAGHFQGHYVWLRVLAEAPSRFGVGQKLLVCTRQPVVKNLW